MSQKNSVFRVYFSGQGQPEPLEVRFCWLIVVGGGTACSHQILLSALLCLTELSNWDFFTWEAEKSGLWCFTTAFCRFSCSVIFIFWPLGTSSVSKLDWILPHYITQIKLYNGLKARESHCKSIDKFSSCWPVIKSLGCSERCACAFSHEVYHIYYMYLMY